jgi:integrase
MLRLRKQGETRLFPLFGVTKYDGKGGSASKWYSQTFRQRASLTRTNHELRNTVITALREADVSETIVAELVGHEWGSTTAFGTYARQSSVAKLQDAINKLPINPGRRA